MTPAEIEVALQAAFNRCDSASCPLTERQKQIMLQLVEEMTRQKLDLLNTSASESDSANPLNELTPDQRQSLLQFIAEQEQQNRQWKMQLLNDWLNNRDSGSVQFIRDRYGTQWLNRVEPVHVAQYAASREELKLKVGDRIEVTNGLWEWVQETGPCSREWFPCTVIRLDAGGGEDVYTNCIIRFNNGTEYEIQGIYEWNRFNWRWPQG